MKAILIGLGWGRRILSAFETLILGAIAVAGGYGIGKIFEHMWSSYEFFENILLKNFSLVVLNKYFAN